MKPGRTYRTAVAHKTTPSRPNVSESRIPLGSLTQVDMRDHSARKGKVRNKVGMWGNLSPYYANSITIDKRWDRTVSDGSDPR